MMGLTPRATALLNFIKAFNAECGFAPSYDEMCHALGMKSKGGIARLLNQIELRGHIHRLDKKPRAIELINHGPTIRCPNCNHEFEPASGHLRRGETLGGSQSPDNAVEGQISRRAA